jgi:hypothetical protein
MPEENERMLLLQRHLSKLAERLNAKTIQYLSQNSKGINAADICKLCEHIKRQTLLNPEVKADIIALTELYKISQLETKEKKKACNMLKKTFPALSPIEIAEITQIPLASVSKYLINKDYLNKNEG